MQIGVGINLMKMGVLGGDAGVALGVGGLLSLATAYLAGNEPHHWFDFTTNKALYAGADVGAISNATGYSFSRASAAYYTNSDGTLERFESGQLRMKRTADAGHNLLLRSQEFDNASWTKTGNNSVITADAIAAPDGTMTADLLGDDSGGGTGLVRLNSAFVTVSSGTSTVSIFAKPAGVNYLSIATSAFDAAGNGTTIFNLAAGTVTAGANHTNATITALANGWYRCCVSFATTTDLSGLIYFGLSEGGSSVTDVPRDGTSTLYIWGAQLNEGSSATAYVATTTTPVYAPRQGDRGVLIEGARTNLLVRSQEFDNASWTKGGTITANAIAAPDGTLTADKLTEAASTIVHQVSQTFTSALTTAYTASAYFKAAERQYAYVFLQGVSAGLDAGIVVNLSSGAVSATIGTPEDSGVEALANGWYRIWARDTATGVASPSARFGCSSTGLAGDATSGYAGDGTSGIYIWQADVQAGAFPSSPIVTTTTSATRAADVLTCTMNGAEELAAAAAASPELVSNPGNPYTATTGWVAGFAVVDGTLTVSGGLLVMTRGAGDSSNPRFVLPLTTVVGRTYFVSVGAVGGTSALTTVSVSPNSSGTGALGSVTAAGTFIFVATGTTSYLTLANNGTAGQTSTLASASIKEIPAGTAALYPLSLWAEFERAVDTGALETYLHIDDGSAGGADVSQINVTSSDTAQYSVSSTAGGGGQASPTVAGAIAINTVTKVAGRTSTNSVTIARGGTLGAEDTIVVIPATPTRLIFGTRQNGASPVFGYIRRAAIFSFALSDAQLQASTT